MGEAKFTQSRHKASTKCITVTLASDKKLLHTHIHTHTHINTHKHACTHIHPHTNTHTHAESKQYILIAADNQIKPDYILAVLFPLIHPKLIRQINLLMISPIKGSPLEVVLLGM